MINVKINDKQFEYDIHSLVKAFYPGEDVTVSVQALNPEFELIFSGNSFIFKVSGTDCSGEASFSENAERPEKKNILKRLLYSVLSKYTGKELPWGDLTGIRPTKIPMKLLTEGKSDSFILDYMKNTYFISDEKGRLALDIAKREKSILDKVHYKDGYSIYIGIPFCPTTCLYCSFTSNPIALWKNTVADYLGCLDKELKYIKESMEGKVLDTIYIGGGTPTTLEAAELEILLSSIDKYFDVSLLSEFTVEAGRADSITIDKLKVLKKHGVTRISVNPQTMNQKTLDVIGRRHTVEDTVRAFNDARGLGFNNINMDIILGLPGEGEAEVTHTINEIVKLKPDSLTVHSLALKRGSRLHERLSQIGMETMINTEATMKIAEEGAAELNLLPYYLYRQKNMAGNFENTGYAREGAYGIYNILIMEEVQTIVACGAGTVTK
ncbi:MAG: coproporphyrinogen dehydrogenase HemZ, partial [Lachnospiraceae bacterium]|nr:coproporphyrinogen dehydrogenase HemZ [Lachnospiraceae bacterium]